MGISEATKQKLEDNLHEAIEKETPESLNEFLNEQKPANKVESKFKVGDEISKKHNSDINKFGRFLITCITDGKYWYNDRIICDISEQDDWELVEQKPAENKGMDLVEEDMTPFQKKVFCIVDTAIEEEQGLFNICNELLALAVQDFAKNHARAEKGAKGNDMEIPFTAWGEEDEHGFENCFYAIKETFKGVDNPHRVGTVNWLKSLRDRIQPKQEWSEEDEKNRKDVIGLLEGWMSTFKETCYAQDCKRGILWLKSLRPQKQWKPTEVQLSELKKVFDNEHGGWDDSIIESLYNELKNL